MRKILIFVLVLLFIGPTIVMAAKRPLGLDAEIKFEYLGFMDDRLKYPPMDTWMFIGFGVYKELFVNNLYLGIESGWAGTSGIIDACGFTDTSGINYVPIELNVKYKIELRPRWDFTLGTGVSYNYFQVDINENTEIGPLEAKSNTWLFGGQFFGELSYKFGNWFLGITAKYQVTEEARITTAGPHASVKELFPGGRMIFGGPGLPSRKTATIPADNLRLGIQIGYSF